MTVVAPMVLDPAVGVTGTLAGIARHRARRAAMEAIDSAEVTFAGGIVGDFRGRMRGKPYKRQVTLIERGDWTAALAEVGQAIDWIERRANLLVDGFDLPQVPGTLLGIGVEVVLEIMCETDPCPRMNDLAAGLEAAMRPDWRGGVCARVVREGTIRIGDTIERLR
jgi:MOSC domain-containing protein YiiM